MNNLIVSGDVGTKIVSYLPDQQAFKVAGVSKGLRDASYSGRVWIERRLPNPEWLPRFFLPPAGAGEMVETILHTYRHLSSSYGRNLPSYADRQLLLANKYPDLADRYPHVIPGVAILRSCVSAERWVQENMTLAGRVFRCIATYYLADFVLAQLRAAVTEFGVIRAYITFSSTLFLVMLVKQSTMPLLYPHIALFVLATGPVVLVDWMAKGLVDKVSVRLPGIAGRVAQVATAVQLVIQRALQPLTCKVRVMVRRYWPS